MMVISFQYLGYWYGTYSNINSFIDPGDHCIRATYRPLSKCSIVKFLFHNISYPNTILDETAVFARNVGYGIDELYQQVCGIAWQVDPDNEPGHLVVQFYGPPGDYLILDTDYESFSAIYSCIKMGDFYQLTQTIITRSNQPDIQTVRIIYYFVKEIFHDFSCS